MKGKICRFIQCTIMQLCHCCCTPKFFTFKWFSNATLHHFYSNFSIFTLLKEIKKFFRLISVKWCVICLNIHNICLIARLREENWIRVMRSSSIFDSFSGTSSFLHFSYSCLLSNRKVFFSEFLLCCYDNKFLLYLFSLILLLMFSQLGLNGDVMKG